MITNNFNFFASSLISQIPFDISSLQLDHFGYQTSSSQNYESLKEESKIIGDLISENIVSNRRVAIFKFKEPFKYQNYNILGFELVEPKENQECKSELDHLEFVIPVTFDEYISQYPNVEWDISAKDRDEFPKISVHLKDGKSIKFHRKDIFEEIPN